MNLLAALEFRISRSNEPTNFCLKNEPAKKPEQVVGTRMVLGYVKFLS
jgi:hypothetical protein